MSRTPYATHIAQNLLPTGDNAAELLAYQHALAMGFPSVIPPHLLAPSVMNPAPRITYVPVATPIFTPVLPPAPPAAIPIPPAIQQYLPQKATPAPPPEVKAATPPVVIPLNQIVHGLESSAPDMQQNALQGLQKLMIANPDFKAPHPGSVPEAILLKALQSPNELLMGQVLSSMAGDLQSTTPRLRAQLRKVAQNAQFFPPTKDIAKKLATGQTNFMPAGNLDSLEAVTATAKPFSAQSNTNPFLPTMPDAPFNNGNNSNTGGLN